MRSCNIRDYDRDALLDFYNGEKQTGNFGINIHRAESTGTTNQINKYSAGCQVFQNANDFEQFMALCEQHHKLYGNSFTYALVDFRSMRRVTIKRVVTALSVSAAMALGWMVFTD
jgi:hypothetical protein